MKLDSIDRLPHARPLYTQMGFTGNDLHDVGLSLMTDVALCCTIPHLRCRASSSYPGLILGVKNYVVKNDPSGATDCAPYVENPEKDAIFLELEL
jgi:hypothetical protein